MRHLTRKLFWKTTICCWFATILPLMIESRSTLTTISNRKGKQSGSPLPDIIEPDTTFQMTYNIQGNTYYCSQSSFAGYNFVCPKTLQDVPFKPDQHSAWRDMCGYECVKHAIANPATPCSGYTYNSKLRMCSLKLCSINDDGIQPSKAGTFEFVSFDSDCLNNNNNGGNPQITKSPTAPTVTKKPTIPLPPPDTDTPTTPGGSEFVSPTGIPRSYPVKWEIYGGNIPLKIDTWLCEIITPRLGTSNRKYLNWDGTVDDCVKECTYDGGCSYSIFSPIDRVCIKATAVIVTDDPDRIDDWVNGQYVAYEKSTKHGVLPYVAGYCAGFKGVNYCNDPVCQWNKGKKGENQMADFTNGYCGRIACPASPVKKPGRKLRQSESLIVEQNA